MLWFGCEGNLFKADCKWSDRTQIPSAQFGKLMSLIANLSLSLPFVQPRRYPV